MQDALHELLKLLFGLGFAKLGFCFAEFGERLIVRCGHHGPFRLTSP